jgi:hypothetical protein
MSATDTSTLPDYAPVPRSEWAADDLTAILHDMGLYTPPWLP